MKYHISEFSKEYYKPGEVGKYLGVVQRTVSRFCQEGKIKDIILDSGRRLIPREELIRILDEKELVDYSKRQREDIIYARVSTHKQKNRGDLERQVNKCLAYSQPY